jgi:hypothetical protein
MQASRWSFRQQRHLSRSFLTTHCIASVFFLFAQAPPGTSPDDAFTEVDIEAIKGTELLLVAPARAGPRRGRQCVVAPTTDGRIVTVSEGVWILPKSLPQQSRSGQGRSSTQEPTVDPWMLFSCFAEQSRATTLSHAALPS